MKPTRRPAARVSRAAACGSSALPIATVPAAQIRSFAAAYASYEPCQSRWSGARLSSAPAAGRTDGDQCSWNDDSSTASASYGGSARTASTTGSPTLPVATARSPAARRIASSIRTVVVFPLVPVTASHGAAPAGRNRQASSTSPITSIPAAAAAASSGASGRHPGEVTTSAVPAGGACAPSASTAPAAASVPVRSDATRSATVTRAPSPSSARAAASPDAPAPATSTGRPAHPGAAVGPVVRCPSWPVRGLTRAARRR